MSIAFLRGRSYASESAGCSEPVDSPAGTMQTFIAKPGGRSRRDYRSGGSDAANVKTRRFLAPETHTYREFLRRFTLTVLHPNPRTRLEFLHYYNCHFAPYLPTEEAALQMLAVKLAHLWLERDYPIALHIRRNICEQPVAEYAVDNKISEFLCDAQYGCLACLVEPRDAASLKTSIVLFRGTASMMGRDILSRLNYPSGRLADLDMRGVGRTAFENNQDVLLGWVRTELTKGRSVCLLGHSLGGAYATRLFAALTPDEQAKVHLLSIFPPGIERETLDLLPATGLNVRIIIHAKDIVSLVGDGHPPGQVFLVRDMVYRNRQLPGVHTIPQFAVRELHGEISQFELIETGLPAPPPWAEKLRCFVSRWASSRVLP